MWSSGGVGFEAEGSANISALELAGVIAVSPCADSMEDISHHGCCWPPQSPKGPSTQESHSPPKPVLQFTVTHFESQGDLVNIVITPISKQYNNPK